MASLSSQPSMGVIIGAVIGGLIFGIFIVLAILLYAVHSKGGRLEFGRKSSRIPSSPHYLSAKQQNHYVSMGSLDWKKSSSIVVDGSATLPGRSGLRPPPLRIVNSNHNNATSVGVSTDYPTATIKRNSGGHNQMRTNIEADDNF